MLLLERDDYEDEVMELRERNQELEERNQQLENENDELERNLEKTRNYKRLQQIQKVGKPGTYIFYDY